MDIIQISSYFYSIGFGENHVLKNKNSLIRYLLQYYKKVARLKVLRQLNNSKI